MIRGLLWLPLLAVFFGLAWAGWNEYQKLEAYKVWAAQFERAKYDVYSALGQAGKQLTWGLPTRAGIVETQTLSLTDIQKITLEVNQQSVDPENMPTRGRVTIGLMSAQDEHFRVPFTDGAIAKKWYDFLCKQLSQS